MNRQTKRASMLDAGTVASRIDGYVKAPTRHPYSDGLNELFVGVFWMLLLLLDFLLKAAPSNSIWHHGATFCLCIVPLAIVVFYVQKVLKRRITYRRTGYVKYREIGTRVWRGWLTAGGIAVAFVYIFHHTEPRYIFHFMAPHSFEIAAVVVASAAWGLIYALVTRMDAAWRWVVLVALIVVPPVVTTLPLGQSWSGYLPFVLQGLIFAISGAITLTLYLRRNPVLEQVGE